MLSQINGAPAFAKGSDGGAGGEADDSSKCSIPGPPGGPGGPPGGPGGHRGHHFSGGLSMTLDLSSLNLSDDQKNKISAIRTRNTGKGKELRQSLETKIGEYRNLLFSVSGTNEQITAKHDEIRNVKEELENLRLNDLLAIRAVLTADQRKKLAEAKPPERRLSQRAPGPGDDDKSDKPAK